MNQTTEAIDLSYRPSRWTRTAALVGMTLAIAIAAPARGNREATADSEAERTPIEVEGAESGEQDRLQETTEPIIEELDRPAWALVFHAGLETLGEEVNTTIASGYIPEGLEIAADGTVTLLYRASEGDPPRQWLLEDYTTSSINDEISARLLEGWFPLGFSVVGDTYFVLYGPNKQAATAWRIHRTAVDTEALPGVIGAYRDQGYEIVDFSLDAASDEMWYLFVQTDGTEAAGIAETAAQSRLFINAYPNGEQTAAGISVDFLAGRGTPAGIASGDRLSFVLFEREG